MLGGNEIADWLTSRLGVEVRGETRFEKQPAWVFVPQVFESAPGYWIESKRFYADSAKSVVVFGQYAGTTIDHWLQDSNRLREGFRFLDEQPDGLSWQIRVGERGISSAGEMEALRDGLWRTRGLSLSFVYRADEEEGRDPVSMSAFAALGFCLLLSGVYDQEETLEDGHELEGRRIDIETTRYERSRKNRMLCLSAFGHTCQICGMDMGAFYGDFAEGAIEVHHIRPVSSFEGPAAVDPYKDLVPVCPNCHTALHRVNPPMDPGELRSRIEGRRK